MEEEIYDSTDYMSERAAALGHLAMTLQEITDEESRSLVKSYMKKIVDSVIVDPPIPNFNEDNVVTFGKPKNTPD